MSDTLPLPFGYIRTDIHGNTCEVLGYTAEQLAAAVAADRERIIAAIPGGCSVDPQWVCDMIRAMPCTTAPSDALVTGIGWAGWELDPDGRLRSWKVADAFYDQPTPQEAFDAAMKPGATDVRSDR